MDTEITRRLQNIRTGRKPDQWCVFQQPARSLSDLSTKLEQNRYFLRRQPHKVRYYLERRDPAFAAKMAEVLCVYQEVALLRAITNTNASAL